MSGHVERLPESVNAILQAGRPIEHLRHFPRRERLFPLRFMTSRRRNRSANARDFFPNDQKDHSERVMAGVVPHTSLLKFHAPVAERLEN